MKMQKKRNGKKKNRGKNSSIPKAEQNAAGKTLTERSRIFNYFASSGGDINGRERLWTPYSLRRIKEGNKTR